MSQPSCRCLPRVADMGRTHPENSVVPAVHVAIFHSSVFLVSLKGRNPLDAVKVKIRGRNVAQGEQRHHSRICLRLIIYVALDANGLHQHSSSAFFKINLGIHGLLHGRLDNLSGTTAGIKCERGLSRMSGESKRGGRVNSISLVTA